MPRISRSQTKKISPGPLTATPVPDLDPESEDDTHPSNPPAESPPPEDPTPQQQIQQQLPPSARPDLPTGEVPDLKLRLQYPSAPQHAKIHVTRDDQDRDEEEYEAPANDLDAEKGLVALRDSPEGVKPFYPYSTLIRYAIKGSPEKKLLLEDIYAAIENRFPWFHDAPTGWKNSIRHNLSLNASFEKVPRPLTDRGKGAYWTVNDNVDPRAGVHRVRRKKHRAHSDGSKQLQSSNDSHQHRQESPAALPFAQFADGRGEGSSQGPFMHGGRIVYPTFATFDPNNPGFAQIQMRFPTNGENVEMSLSPEVDDEGNPNWRSIWLNELIKLQHATAEAERNGQDADWYRAMIERLRVAFAPIPEYEEAEEEARQPRNRHHRRHEDEEDEDEDDDDPNDPPYRGSDDEMD